MSDDARMRCTCDPGPDGYPHRLWCDLIDPHFECRDEIDRLRPELSASRERERATAARAARLEECVSTLTGAGNDLASELDGMSGPFDNVEVRAWREAVCGVSDSDAPTGGEWKVDE